MALPENPTEHGQTIKRGSLEWKKIAQQIVVRVPPEQAFNAESWLAKERALPEDKTNIPPKS